MVRAALLVVLLVGAAHAESGPDARPAVPSVEVELLTVGPGDDLYARFGHTALLVRENGRPTQVYNFGYTDFEKPGLVLEFLRGEALFWAAAQSYASTVREYQAEDRSLWLQTLHLSPAQHRALVRLLVIAAAPGTRGYRYHHFLDNCSTRPRDLLDRLFDGRLRQRLAARASDLTYRDAMERGFAGLPAVQVVTQLIVGHMADRPLSLWEASFLPRVLSQALAETRLDDGRPLAGPPRVVYRRSHPESRSGEARGAFLWMAGVFGLLALLTGFGRRRGSRHSGVPLLLLGLGSGLLGSLLLALWAVSDLPELKSNELLLYFWPTDLLLGVVAVAWLRGRQAWGSALRFYALAHLLGLLVGLGGHVTGLLFQQPRTLLLSGAALTAALVGACWLNPRPAAARPEGPSSVQRRSPKV